MIFNIGVFTDKILNTSLSKKYLLGKSLLILITSDNEGSVACEALIQ